jgi:hypothetical protein
MPYFSLEMIWTRLQYHKLVSLNNTKLSTPSHSMMPCTKDGDGQCGTISRAQDDHGDVDKCEYELERDKRVAKLRELMRPMEQASLSL